MEIQAEIMKPGEHKTVQARILAYAEAIGWTMVSREEAEQRRGVERMKDEGGRMKSGSARGPVRT